MKKVLLVIFIALTLSGFSYADSFEKSKKNTFNEIIANNKAFIEEMRVGEKGIVEELVDNPPFLDVISDAKVMFHKIKKLSSKVDEGHLTYREYATQSSDLKADFDIFASEQRDDQKIVNFIGIPVEEYSRAAECWYKSIKGDSSLWTAQDNENYKENKILEMYTHFAKAKEATALIDDMFYELKKKNTAKVVE